MKLVTIDSFKEVLNHYSHPQTLTPLEANKLSLSLIEELSDNPCDKFFLKFISRFLTKQLYDDIVEERNINRICGYPLCSGEPGRIKDHYSKSFEKSKILPYHYLNTYCSKQCYQSSEFYKTQLSDEAIFARNDITVSPYGSMKYELNITLLEEVYNIYEHNQGSRSMMEIIHNLDGLKIKEENKEEMIDDMNRMLEEIKIIENDPESPVLDGISEDDIDKKYEFLQDQSKAIDGYILRI